MDSPHGGTAAGGLQPRAMGLGGEDRDSEPLFPGVTHDGEAPARRTGGQSAVDKVQEAMMRDRMGLVWACVAGSSCAADGGALVPQYGEEHGATHRCA